MASGITETAETGQTNAVLGRAIFGTANGQFASGDGVLAGLSSPEPLLDFRATLTEYPLDPSNGSDYLLFRIPVSLGLGDKTDLIGVLSGCKDAAGRDGSFGVCAAVPLGAFEEYKAAYDTAANLFPNATSHYQLSEDGQCFGNPAPFFPRPTKDAGWKSFELRALARKLPGLLVSHSVSEHDRISDIDAIMIVSEHAQETDAGRILHTSIFAYQIPREGIQNLETHEIERFSKINKDKRRERLRRIKEQERKEIERKEIESKKIRNTKNRTYSDEDIDEIVDKIKRLEHQVRQLDAALISKSSSIYENGESLRNFSREERASSQVRHHYSQAQEDAPKIKVDEIIGRLFSGSVSWILIPTLIVVVLVLIFISVMFFFSSEPEPAPVQQNQSSTSQPSGTGSTAQQNGPR